MPPASPRCSLRANAVEMSGKSRLPRYVVASNAKLSPNGMPLRGAVFAVRKWKEKGEGGA